MTVYFIASGRRIKIGFTTNLKKRVAQLQTSASDRIKVLAAVDGDRKLERSLHDRLERHRTSGEWFKNNADVLAALEETVATFPPAPPVLPKAVPTPQVTVAEEFDSDRVLRLIEDFGADIHALKNFINERAEPINALPFCRRHEIKSAYKATAEKHLSEIMITAARDNQARQVAKDEIKRRCERVKALVLGTLRAA